MYKESYWGVEGGRERRSKGEKETGRGRILEELLWVRGTKGRGRKGRRRKG